MSIYDEMGDTIVWMRRQKDMIQEWLALECEISISYLLRIEHGTANPTIGELYIIAHARDMELRNLLAIPVGAMSRRILQRCFFDIR